KYWSTDWENTLINNSAIRRENSIAVNGGGESTTYAFSANNLSQEGALRGSDFDRTAVRLNIATRVNKTISAGLNMGYTASSQKLPNSKW
ncbi:hypothetical protein BXU11_17520, partial [Flavobacterium sp. LM5]|uniref:hypothetical protein n=1 Tax=Flavobacterium sp. LM5 TaxID=1938610 RepID=UPI0009C4C08B